LVYWICPAGDAERRAAISQPDDSESRKGDAPRLPKPFTAIAADIYAKALTLEDLQGRRAVLVTADLAGFQAAVTTDEVCRRIGERTGLARHPLLLSASHTHTGRLVSLDPPSYRCGSWSWVSAKVS
jgi:hypothetical protein